MIWLLVLLSAVAYPHAHHEAEHAPASQAGLPPKLAPGQSLSGVKRAELRPPTDGEFSESPALAALPDGRVAVAWVQFDSESHRERLLLRTDSSPGTFGEVQVVSEGPRVWRPVLRNGTEGRLWAVWCGAEKFPERGDHERGIFLRRLLPTLGETQRISGSVGRNCDPSMAMRPDGGFAVAWENSDLRDAHSRIAWRVFKAEGSPVGAPVFGKPGWLDRRPVVESAGDGWLLAWDRWVDRGPSGLDDPDYDVYGVALDARGRCGTETRWAGGEGIQAAPSLAAVDAQTVALAFHSSQGHSLVKHARLAVLKRSGKEWAASFPKKPLKNEWGETDSRGEQQGSEFPHVVFSATPGLVFTSRPSQGFFLHRLEGNEIRTWDLTTGGWSARGIHAALAWGPKGELWIARRGARTVVVERLELSKQPAPEFQNWTAAEAAASPGKPFVRAKPPKVPGSNRLKVFYGDVHMHSGISDAAGAPDEVLARAYVRGLDFATLTDHDRVGGGRMVPSEYAEIAWLTDQFNRLKDFVTLHAYEWTTVLLPKGSGHRNVYFRGYGPTEVYTNANGHGDTRTLFNALRTEKAFAVPHHTTWTGTDWENHDEAIQRHVEVTSVHGASDEPNGPIESRGEMTGMFAVDGLKKGLRFGFIAGTDGHGLIYHHGIARHRDPWAHAVTGVLAEKAEREALWQEIFERHTFGTSGPRSQVYLRVGTGARQGDSIQGPAPWLLEIEARMLGEITEVALFRNGEKWKVLPVAKGAREMRVKIEDAPGELKEVSYFLRVTEKGPEGRLEAAWTSPVFLSER